MQVKRYRIINVMVLTLALSYGVIAYAAEDTQTSNITFTIPPIVNLDLTGDLLEPTINGLDLDAGYKDTTAAVPSLTVTSNDNWELKVTTVGWTAPWSKPTTDLMLVHTNGDYVVNGFNSFKALSDTDQTIASSASAIAMETFDCQYRILLDPVNDTPGSYSITITFTLSSLA